MPQSADSDDDRDRSIAAQIALRKRVDLAEEAVAAAREAIHQRNLGVCDAYRSGLKTGTILTITRLSPTRLTQIRQE
jgi:hypothetical protein